MRTTDGFLDRETRQPVPFAQPAPVVRWWIPLVASTGALLVLVGGTAVAVAGLVNQTIGSLG